MREELKQQNFQNEEEEARWWDEQQEAPAAEFGKVHEAAPSPETPAASDPLLRLRSSGRDIWGKEDAVDYVRRLRDT